MNARRAAVLVGVVLLAGCADDGPPRAASPGTASPASVPSTGAPAVPVPAGTVAVSTTAPEPAPVRTTTTTEPKPEIPDGELVAVPIQHRPDPAKNQFQLKIVNGTTERLTVASVQLVWDGLTTEVAVRERPGVVVAGQRVDYPVPLPAATCVGDGTRATMPSLDPARVLLTDDTGGVREVPVVDPDFVLRRLYEEDCRRQFVESQVAIEWVDVREGEFEGRPVTLAELRLTRRAATGEVAVLAISDTIPFVVDPVDTGPGEVVASLPAGADQTSVPVRFVESRCDPHALAEITQPTKFVAQVSLDGGDPLAYIVYPERPRWDEMRATADRACVQLGKVVFVGDD